MNIFDLASERLGIDMKKLCFEGDELESTVASIRGRLECN